MKINVKYFGIIAEKIGLYSEEIEMDVSKKIDLRAFFNLKHPEIKEITYKIAINQEITDFLELTKNQIEVALLPPFAGG
jgi:molybdopterin synthase sulfur carrier subunit